MNLEEKVKEINDQIEATTASIDSYKSSIRMFQDRVKLLTKTLKSYEKLIAQAKDLENEEVRD